MSKPFKVINCFSQGFAVAGPVEDPKDGQDLEMIQWGMAMDAAMALRDRLNCAVQDKTRPEHVTD